MASQKHVGWRAGMGSETANKKVVWLKLDSGIRCREHPSRKHGVKPDRYFVLRFTVDGKTQQEALGWASEGMTLAKARIELARLKEAKRTGEGARSLRERRKQEEKRRKAQEIAERLSGEKISFSMYWDKFYWPAQAHKAKGSQVAEDALWKKWIKPVIGSISLDSLGAAALEQIKSNMLTDGKSPASIKYALAVVSQVWNMAFRSGIVTGVCPVKHVILPKKDNRRQRYLNKREAEEFLEVLAKRSPISRDMAILGLDCGLRFGEIASLCWEDCDFNREQMLIRDPKARANRYAFMTQRVKDMLLQRRTVGGAGFIFLDKNGNKLGRISNTFRRIADEMFNNDINDSRLKVCFHTLRHTFASWLVEAGIGLYEIKELMGHADFSMTQRYSHLSPEGLRKAIRVLDGNNNGKI